MICREAQLRIDMLRTGELPSPEAEEVEAHMESCPACRKTAADSRAFAALAALLPQARLDEARKAAVLREARASRARPRLRAFAAAAAAVMLLAAAGVYVLLRGTPTPTYVPPPLPAMPEPPAADPDSALLEEISSRPGAVMRLAIRPPYHEIRIGGPPPTPAKAAFPDLGFLARILGVDAIPLPVDHPSRPELVSAEALSGAAVLRFSTDKGEAVLILRPGDKPPRGSVKEDPRFYRAGIPGFRAALAAGSEDPEFAESFIASLKTPEKRK